MEEKVNERVVALSSRSLKLIEQLTLPSHAQRWLVILLISYCVTFACCWFLRCQLYALLFSLLAMWVLNCIASDRGHRFFGALSIIVGFSSLAIACYVPSEVDPGMLEAIWVFQGLFLLTAVLLYFGIGRVTSRAE